MTGLIAYFTTVVVLVGAIALLDPVVSAIMRSRRVDEVDQSHMQAMQAAQRIQAVTWRARQDLLDEARRSQGNR